MNKLLSYYQKELVFLKQHGKVFAQRFPKIARRLGMVDGGSEDPHVERLIESFALLTARIHQRLDDDMPEVAQALLTTLAPQFLRPIPSTCIVAVEPDRLKSGITEKTTIPAGTSLFSRHISEAVCQFQTVYAVTLQPLAINNARFFFDKNSLNWCLHLRFDVWSGATVNGDNLRVFLHGPSNAVNMIYTLLCSAIKTLSLHYGEQHYSLKPNAVNPVGFQAQEGVLAKDPRIASIYALLQEYFCFPQKFHFLDLQLPKQFRASANTTFELDVVFNRTHLAPHLEKLAGLIDENFFRLHCTPAVNLFAQCAEPIMLNEGTAEYPVIPDIRRQDQIDIWAINDVIAQTKQHDNIVMRPILPLFGIQHTRQAEGSGIYWQSFQRQTVTANGTDNKVFIAFANTTAEVVTSDADIVTISLSCTNHSLPSQMKNGHPEGDFDADMPLAGIKILALNRPTRPIMPPASNAVQWRLISQLSINHMSLGSTDGANILRETLMLYNVQELPQITRMIDMLLRIEVQPVTARLNGNDPHSLARGIELTLVFHQDMLHEPEYYLLCCFLDHFLGLYAPVNSFSRVTTIIENEPYTRHTYPIRVGRLSWI
ncbi:type VI secretion system baseplate subunit TssF [Serratia sp. JSRIV006]|uniref:type VI secretion system baseplate subunit TssF n=1 Tax=Serratia sp. JSRIV006 TaxID=2831896 RepID=UPI001CC09DF2|nr:type VI secretion system baseplate subunit TssF [Serratia sp. JSRIV006]UAN62236.1 type VI secretion system baseplate subunit TssF [Serratia sp. JSRIV006]